MTTAAAGDTGGPCGGRPVSLATKATRVARGPFAAVLV
jgi:hypothetical protein